MTERGVLLERHQTALERFEEREARRVAAAYRRARQEIVERLIAGWTDTANMTPGAAAQRLRQLGLLEQIDARLLTLEREMGIVVRDLVTASSEMAIEQIRQQMELLPATVARPNLTFAMLNARMVDRFVPLALSDVQLGTRALALQLQRELQAGLIQGESFPALVKRLMAQTPGDLGISTWRNGATSAERATRRLVITAENASRSEAMSELRQSGLEVRRQAIAAIGPTTTDCCLQVHGQIVAHDEPFTLTGTPRFADRMMNPAFHWNCRTAVALYHVAFESGGLTTASLRQSAEAELKKR